MFRCFSARVGITGALTLASFFNYAQQQIAAIPLKGNWVSLTQCAFSGDTTFIAYVEQSGGWTYYRTRLVFSDGTSRVIRDSRLMDKAFIGIDNANDSLYIYYLEEKRKTISITYVTGADSAKTSIVAHKLTKGELFLGTFKRADQRGFSIVTASPMDRLLTVLRVHGSCVVQDRKIELPLSFFEKKPSSFAFIPEGYIPSPKEAEARTKVYWNTDQVIITEDVAPNLMTKEQGKTTMVSIDLTTGKRQSRLILEPDEIDFSTYVHKNVLYKIKKDRKLFTVETFDSLNKKIHSFQINKKSSYLNEQAYRRNNRSLRVSNDRTVNDAISKSGNSFVSVHPIEGNMLLFKIGTHHELTDPSSIPMLVAFGVVGSAIISALVNTDDYQMYPPEYSDHYFYLKGTGFDYSKGTNFVHERIDAFENHSKENEFSFKSYAQNQNEIIGIYVPKNIQELRIVRFAK